MRVVAVIPARDTTRTVLLAKLSRHETFGKVLGSSTSVRRQGSQASPSQREQVVSTWCPPTTRHPTSPWASLGPQLLGSPTRSSTLPTPKTSPHGAIAVSTQPWARTCSCSRRTYLRFAVRCIVPILHLATLAFLSKGFSLLRVQYRANTRKRKLIL